ncbi:amidophosphoribosyltransferase [Bifidobacterium pullorum subsp. saeculare DSM 6531 = LMG 14934]|uniref:Amidophosphoribosyltransferase n=1 Tax=Bifidobacterium pullorum subsp. saeculare DSM 6531 = LMG 14934 TaxID=1437611 RepID=A0A087D161_9BIFI|nr:amidophosphoribosyltransferase [Bifidobacterium pullorum subsp. saeculare DSM 6531 = LMG 14934]
MSAELEDIHEECGIFGVWGHPDAARLTYFGLHALQHRGQEGAGIVSNDHGHLIGHRGLGLLTQVFSDEREIQRLRGDRAIGHVRYATAGSGSTDNIQPFIFRFSDGDMALAHNGNLTNCPTLRRELESQGAIFRSNSDTEVLMHLIRRSEQPTFVDKLKEALNTVHGGFAYLLMTENAMIGALDPNGFRPLSLGRMTNGAYVLASETCALDIVGAELVRDIRPGEIVVVDDDGYRIDTYTDQTQLAICSMEFIYFARPDSNIYGVNVHSARKRMGARLAQESPVDADMVIAVPNSSLSAASGYSEAAHLPNEMGLIKNQYVARTFIQPTQELREQGVRMKLAAVRGVVSGKRVVVVDDSIVRGTTSKRLVQLLREAGASEVHMRISSPPLKYPCFYGIDISTTKELIAAKKSVEEIREFIGADTLAFLSLDGLIESIGLNADAPYGGLCVAYFNGDYPTALDDYEQEFLASLTPEDRVRLPKFALDNSDYQATSSPARRGSSPASGRPSSSPRHAPSSSSHRPSATQPTIAAAAAPRKGDHAQSV